MKKKNTLPSRYYLAVCYPYIHTRSTTRTLDEIPRVGTDAQYACSAILALLLVAILQKRWTGGYPHHNIGFYSHHSSGNRELLVLNFWSFSRFVYL